MLPDSELVIQVAMAALASGAVAATIAESLSARTIDSILLLRLVRHSGLVVIAQAATHRRRKLVRCRMPLIGKGACDIGKNPREWLFPTRIPSFADFGTPAALPVNTAGERKV
jgi:hypothetical protein